MQFLQGSFMVGLKRCGFLKVIPLGVCHASKGAVHDIFLVLFYSRYPPRIARGRATFLRCVLDAVFVNSFLERFLPIFCRFMC